MDKKYQTTNQVLLDILLQGVKEDLRLSYQRLQFLADENDEESAHAEKQYNDSVKEKLSHIKHLVNLERFTHSSAISTVKIGFVGFDTSEEWHSSEIN